MRQSDPFYSTRSGNSKLSSFLGNGRFLDLFRRIYCPCTYMYIALRGGGAGDDSHVTRMGMFVPSKDTCKIFKKIITFLLIYKTCFDVTNIIKTCFINCQDPVLWASS